MKPRVVLLSLLGLGVLAAAIAWWLHTFQRTTEWIDLPRTGEAATNPLFGLRVVLEKDGRRVRGAYRLDPAALRLSPGDTVVYDGDPRALPTRTRDALLAWLRAGGHLVIATPPADAAADRFAAGGDARPLPVPLLDAVGARVWRGPGRCLDDARGLPFAFCQGRRFDAPAHATVRIGDAAGDVYARIPVGRGRVDLLASMELLETDALRTPVNNAFAHQVLADAGRRGTVHVVHSTDVPSLWWMLVREGWPVWVPLALALAGWLAARMRRFGPTWSSPALERRSLLEHVDASGQLQWRYGHADALHAAMLDAFHARLRRRDPQTAALEGAPQVARLVERTGLPAARITDALTPPDPRDAKALVARIATLVRMRNRL